MPPGRCPPKSDSQANMKRLLYIGSSNGDSPAGLRVFEFDCSTGALAEVGRVEDAINPIYLALSADGTRLYASQEVAAGASGETGGVAAYEVDGTSLYKIGEWPCAPTVPCHVSISQDGRRLYFAEYAKAWGPDGYLKKQGMVVAPDDVRAKNAEIVSSMKVMDGADLK